LSGLGVSGLEPLDGISLNTGWGMLWQGKIISEMVEEDADEPN
jgi:hypothetical protein